MTRPKRDLSSPAEVYADFHPGKRGKVSYGVALYHPVRRSLPAPELLLRCAYPRTPSGKPCRNLVTLEQRELHGIGICEKCYERMRRRLDPGPLDAD